ncbi:cutinase family protein [Nocardia sp. NPDC004068]|uniref:cutinase family protein n=1 Tax=Nocardia sp. NPDC004068 TaxID=3364303 RepID=UPI00368B5D2C
MPTRHHYRSPRADRSHRRVARALLCTAVAALTAAGAGIAAADPTPAATPCPRWTALLVPAASETTSAPDPARPEGLLAPVAEALRARYGRDIDVRTVTYTPDSRSETAGTQAVSAALAGLCSDTRVVLAGYSDGARGAGDLAAAIGHNQGPIPASRVVAVGLVADPRRDPATPQLGRPLPGQGILGLRSHDFGALTDRVRTLCDEHDLTCATPAQATPALAPVGRAVTATPASDDPLPAPGPALFPTPGAAPTATPVPDSTPAPVPDPSAGSTMPSGGLDAAEVLDQVVSVLGALSRFAANVPTIAADLAQLPALISTGDIPGLHRIAGDLNNQFRPLVDLLAGIDLHLVAQALTLAAPLDTTGWTALAAQIVDLLADLDITRIATDLGHAQETAWTALEALAAGDPLAALLAVSRLAPIATDLAATTATAFTGTRLPTLADSFTAATAPTTSTALTDMARRMGDAAHLTNSQAHPSSYSTNIEQIVTWLDNRIDTDR